MAGLRERKRAETRQALHLAAVRLAAEREWHATTVADIAAAAGVAPRTFFGYFPTKEDALYAVYDDLFDGFDELMLTRPHGGSVLEELRAWLADVFVDQVERFDPEVERVLDRLTGEVDAVAARGLQLMDRAERGLEAALRAERGSGPDDPVPRLVAAAAIAALRAIPTARPDESPAQRVARGSAGLDLAFDFIEGGVAALDRAAPPRTPAAPARTPRTSARTRRAPAGTRRGR